MKRKEALERLRHIKKYEGDIELNHILADEILCQLLAGLGFKDVVDEYNEIDKWYA